MNIRNITEGYNVSPQISAEDVPAIKAAGITTVICNRPDMEVPPTHKAAAIRAAVEAEGLRFEEVPITHQTMTPDRVSAQLAIIEASEGPVLAYCASGTRSSVLWALSQATQQSADDILKAVGQAGYDLSGMRPMLEAAAAQQG